MKKAKSEEARFSDIEDRCTTIEATMERVEKTFINIYSRLDKLERTHTNDGLLLAIGHIRRHGIGVSMTLTAPG